MIDRDAMLAAIRAEPDEDTPRLALADWLDEHGDPGRAAFIRLQIEVMRAELFSLPARAAAKGAEELLKKHRAEWQRPLREAIQKQYPSHVAVQVNQKAANPLPDVVQVQVRFERGFVSHIECQPDDIARTAEAMFAVEPIQSLKLYRFTGEEPLTPLEVAFAVPQLQKLRRLEFAPLQATREQEYAELLACPHLSGLRDLSLRENPVPPPWVGELLASDKFPELHGLDFSEIPNLGPTLASTLSRANHRDIRRLNVSSVVFTSDHLRQVLTSRCLRKVEELRLGCFVDRGAAAPLAQLNPGWVIPWEKLTILDIRGQRLGTEAVGEMLRDPRTAALRSLGLAFNGIDGGIVRHFTELKHLQLNHIDVRGNNLTPSAMTGLKQRFPDALIEV
ncbi:MAG: TIGR02996 domain-containing protein [Gemmataceae bacterium]